MISHIKSQIWERYKFSFMRNVSCERWGYSIREKIKVRMDTDAKNNDKNTKNKKHT